MGSCWCGGSNIQSTLSQYNVKAILGQLEQQMLYCCHSNITVPKSLLMPSSVLTQEESGLKLLWNINNYSMLQSIRHHILNISSLHWHCRMDLKSSFFSFTHKLMTCLHPPKSPSSSTDVTPWLRGLKKIMKPVTTATVTAAVLECDRHAHLT